MSAEKTIAEILEIGKVCQYLSLNDQAQKLFLKGNSNSRLPYMIACETVCNQWAFETNPANPSLRATSNYAFALYGPYATQAEAIIEARTDTPPVVSGPADATVTVGGTASFTILYTSAIPATIAWYKNSVLVPGEVGLTYSFTTVLGDDGDIINAIVTNGAGSTPSANAVLTVTTALIGSYYYGSTNYYPYLSIGVDNVNFLGTFNIVDGQPLSVLFPSGAANNVNQVIRYPISQGPKSQWFNTVLNSGSLPDQAYRSIITIGSFLYICSRDEISIDTSAPVIFS